MLNWVFTFSNQKCESPTEPQTLSMETCHMRRVSGETPMRPVPWPGSHPPRPPAMFVEQGAPKRLGFRIPRAGRRIQHGSDQGPRLPPSLARRQEGLAHLRVAASRHGLCTDGRPPTLWAASAKPILLLAPSHVGMKDIGKGLAVALPGGHSKPCCSPVHQRAKRISLVLL